MTEVMSAPPPPPASSSQTIDFAQPFRFVFDDPDWIKKIVIGGLFYLLSFLLIGLFFIGGYTVLLCRNVIRGVARPLPEWDDLGTYFVDGVKVLLICLLYALPILVVWLLLFGGAALSGSFENEDIGAIIAGMSGCVTLLMVLVILLYSLFLPAALLMFVATGSIAEAFNIRRIVRFVTNNPANYILAWLVYLVSNFLSQFGIVLLCIGVIFTAFWGVVVAAYAFADAYRLARVR